MAGARAAKTADACHDSPLTALATLVFLFTFMVSAHPGVNLANTIPDDQERTFYFERAGMAARRCLVPSPFLLYTAL
jgi:hypothetical protein